jgi:diguanylate cyclase (GGDEF)-like protein
MAELAKLQVVTYTKHEDDVADIGDYDGSITAVLEEVRQTSGLEGLAILDLTGTSPASLVSYQAGFGGPATIATGRDLLVANPGGPMHTVAGDKRPIIVCPWLLPPNQAGGLMMWRGPGERRWTDGDHGLVASISVLLRASIATGLGQIGIDRLTGLPNRRWFIDEVDRHLDRMDVDSDVGTLMLIYIDDLNQLNASLGRETGDSVLVRLGGYLRGMVRPGDLIARINGDQFAVWQGGMDHLTAAERADALCARRLFQDLPAGHAITVSVGIASRPFGSQEDVRTMLRRAHMAAREVKAQGGGGWRVSHAVPAGGEDDSTA